MRALLYLGFRKTRLVHVWYTDWYAMRPSYLLLRNETYHLCLRVPLTLKEVIGCTEPRLSLFEGSQRVAMLKAGYLAYQIRQFFSHVRRLMKHFPRTEIDRLVRDWKARMIERDGEVRRLIETGLGSMSLMAYGAGCDAMGDEYRSLAEAILPPSVTDTHAVPAAGQTLIRARARAVELATQAASDDDAPDWSPLIDRAAYDNLDAVSGRGLIQTWLPEAASLYYAKSVASEEPGRTLKHLCASASEPAQLHCQLVDPNRCGNAL